MQELETHKHEIMIKYLLFPFPFLTFFSFPFCLYFVWFIIILLTDKWKKRTHFCTFVTLERVLTTTDRVVLGEHFLNCHPRHRISYRLMVWVLMHRFDSPIHTFWFLFCSLLYLFSFSSLSCPLGVTNMFEELHSSVTTKTKIATSRIHVSSFCYVHVVEWERGGNICSLNDALLMCLSVTLRELFSRETKERGTPIDNRLTKEGEESDKKVRGYSIHNCKGRCPLVTGQRRKRISPSSACTVVHVQ